MAAICPQMRLAELAEGKPWIARILVAHGLDPGSSRVTLARACPDPNTLLELLERVADGPQGLQSLSQRALIHHIVECHHRYVRRVFPRLLALAQELTRRYPQLQPLLTELQLFGRTKNPHMFREEQVVFPAIRDLDRDPSMAVHLGRWISTLLSEHDATRQNFTALRRLTQNFQFEPVADPDYQLLVAGLCDLDQDMAWHIYAENDLLFPRAESACRVA